MSDVVQVVAHTFEVAHQVDENAAAFGATFAASETLDVVFHKGFALGVDLLLERLHFGERRGILVGENGGGLFGHRRYDVHHTFYLVLDHRREVQVVLNGAAGVFAHVVGKLRHTVDVADATVQGGYFALGDESGVIGGNLSEIIAYFGGVLEYFLVGFGHFFYAFSVPGEETVHCRKQAVGRFFQRFGGFRGGAVDRYRRSGKQTFVEAVGNGGYVFSLVRDLFLTLAHEEGGGFDEKFRERQEYDSAYHVEESVEHCNLHTGQTLEQHFEGHRRHIFPGYENDEEYDGTDDVEEQVNDRGAFCVDIGAYGRNEGGDAGAYVGAEHHEHNGVAAAAYGDSRRRHRNENGGDRRRTLHDCRHGDTEEEQQERIVNARKCVGDGFAFPDCGHRISHNPQSHEHETETGYRERDGDRFFFLCEYGGENSYSGECGGESRDVEFLQCGNQARHGGAYVGAHNYGGGIGQRHNARIDQPDDHNRGEGGTLHYCRGGGADSHSRKSAAYFGGNILALRGATGLFDKSLAFLVGKSFRLGSRNHGYGFGFSVEEILEARRRQFLHIVGEQFDADKERSETGNEFADYIDVLHRHRSVRTAVRTKM